jgi:hypothetical protein
VVVASVAAESSVCDNRAIQGPSCAEQRLLQEILCLRVNLFKMFS